MGGEQTVYKDEWEAVINHLSDNKSAKSLKPFFLQFVSKLQSDQLPLEL